MTRIDFDYLCANVHTYMYNPCLHNHHRVQEIVFFIVQSGRNYGEQQESAVQIA